MLLDLRYGIRILRRAPGFALVAILTLALGIGTNTAVFSLIRAVFLAPLPFPDSERLVTIGERRSSSGDATLSISGHEFAAWQEQTRTLESIALFNHEGLTLTGIGEPDQLDVARVSASFFPVLQAQPVLGRVFAAGEDRAGSNHVLLLSDGLWRRHFAADPGVVGRTVALNNEAYTVVGVMPPLPAALSPDGWAPIDVPAQVRTVGRHNLQALGRLRPAVTPRTALDDLESISSRLAREMPGDNTDHHPRLASLREDIVGEIRPASRMLIGAAGFVLLIGCANVANLLLTRGAGRQKEIAVRLALGAGRSRVVRQLLLESVLVAVLGGLAGLLLAAWIIDLVPRLSGVNLPLADTSRLDWRALLFAAAMSVLTGMIAGAAPALRGAQRQSDALRDGTRISGDRRRSGLRVLLVGAEVALTMTLLLGAGLMAHSFVRLVAVDAGFRAAQTLVVPLDLPPARYPTAASQRGFYDRLLGDLRVIPGVESVGATSHLPLGGSDNWMPFSIAGHPPAAPGQSPTAAFRSVTPGYFRTLGIPVVSGRGFDDSDARLSLPLVRWYPQQPIPPDADRPQSRPVAVVSEAAARQFWPGESPIGRRIRVLFSPDVTIVGVVGDVRHNRLNLPAYPHVYLSHNQEPWNSVSVVVRTAVDPARITATVRDRVHAADPLLPVAVRTLDDVRAASVAKPRLYAGLAGLFSATALALAVVGIVGVLSYNVAQRTREIGVRVALGAERDEILRLVVRQGMRPVLAGVGIGLAGGVALMRSVQSLLFEVAPTDPLALLLMPLLMTIVALAACWIPARRAAALDPVTALRAE